MAKLIFYFGAMGSGKTEKLIYWYDKVHKRDKNAFILTSSIDSRSALYSVQSRKGQKRMAIPLRNEDTMEDVINMVSQFNPFVVLADEIQFMAKHHIDAFIHLVDEKDISVCCFGLLTDFKGEFFETSQYLLRNADYIESINSLCQWCTKPAIRNTRFDVNGAVFDGPQIQVGGDETYKSLCRKCYNKLKAEALVHEEKSKCPKCGKQPDIESTPEGMWFSCGDCKITYLPNGGIIEKWG